MFTGIIETTTAVLQKNETGMTLARPSTFDDLTIGSSINVNGACLSVIKMSDKDFSFDIVPETWSKTNLGDLQVGDHVNLERAMKAGDRFEGHIVQGHVEDVGTVRKIEHLQPVENGALLTIDLPESLRPFVIYKGSISLNGISLTVADLHDNHCTIALIPHTLSVTNLGKVKVGDKINIETDMLGRYVLTSKQYT